MDVGGNSLPNSINPNHYPAKLWRLVNNPANEAICWDSEGTFVIIDQLLFEKQILSPDPKNLDNADAFKTTNFLSIVRQLYMYGFRKAGLVIHNDVQSGGEQKRFHHFYNPNFKRNHPELLGSLMRFTVNNRVRVRVSTMQDNPLCDTPITISTLGSVYVDKEQEELVLSVPEKMPEDAIIQRFIYYSLWFPLCPGMVTRDDVEDTEVIDVGDNYSLVVTGQADKSSCTGSTPNL